MLATVVGRDETDEAAVCTGEVTVSTLLLMDDLTLSWLGRLEWLGGSPAPFALPTAALSSASLFDGVRECVMPDSLLPQNENSLPAGFFSLAVSAAAPLAGSFSKMRQPDGTMSSSATSLRCLTAASQAVEPFAAR